VEELFSGNRKRFKGVWIDKSDYDFPYHPVIYLSMSFRSTSEALLETELSNNLLDIAEEYDVNIVYNPMK
jgi:hypothetical protein